jgi:hypothetical protein
MSGLQAGAVWAVALAFISRPARWLARFIGSWRFTVFLWGPFLLYWLVDSSILIRPTVVQIDGYTVRVHREYPLRDWLGFDPPIVSYIETVRRGDELPPCIDRDEFRHSGTHSFGEWSIEAWAAPCMTGPYVWRAEWRAYLFDFILLRPVSLTYTSFGGVIS